MSANCFSFWWTSSSDPYRGSTTRFVPRHPGNENEMKWKWKMKIPGVSTVHVENKAVLKLLGLDESDHNCCTLDALIVKVQIDCFSGGSRICKRGAKVERPRRKYRGAEGAEEGVVWGGGFPLTGGGVWEGAVSPPQISFLTLDLKMSTSNAFWSLFLQFSY